jgi:HlyD family type I secretion membrane fusion protein
MTDIRRPSHDIRRVSLTGFAIIVITFGVIGGWAAFVPLSSAVMGHGIVTVESNRQTIQHYEGGIVRQILVHEGDHVHAGQTLFDLSPVQADASLESARNQLFSLLAKADRLAAERDGRPSVTFSPEVRAQSGDPIVAQAMTDESRQFQERRGTINDEVAVLRTRISEFQTEIQGIDEQRASMQQQVGMLDEELGNLTTLYQKNLVPKPRLLELQRERAQLQGQIGGSIADKAKTEKSIGETQLQINQLHQQFDQDVSKDMSDVQTQSADIRQRFAVAQDAAKRISIVAPTDGVVQNLKVFTVGGVVRPGDPLVDIAPDKGNLIVEARFSPNDIDSVSRGQAVQIRFSTFHSRTIPVITGTIRTVSQDRLTDEATHMPYYLAIVDVPESILPTQLKGKLRAGLPVEIVAPTGSRTALQYIFGPLSNALSGTMRER